MSNNPHLTKISKMLSYALRHRPEKYGLELDEEGWATVQDVMDKCRGDIDFDFVDLKEVVDNNDKKRFKFSEDFSRIKANQGHSIKVDLKLGPITPPDKLYHGTAIRFIPLIITDGLKKMNRHHVHMYGEDKTKVAIETAKRHQKGSAPVLLEIDAKRMFKDGIEFFKTDNDVYLTEKVKRKYIKIV